MVTDLCTEERLRYDGKRQTHHVLVDVPCFTVLPAVREARGVIDHDARVRGYALSMECGLCQSPLLPPEVTLTRKEPVAEDWAERGAEEHVLLPEPAPRDENVLDEVGVT